MKRVVPFTVLAIAVPLLLVPGAGAAQRDKAPKLPTIQTAELPASPKVTTRSATLAARSGKSVGGGARELAPEGGFSLIGLTWTGSAPETMEVRWREQGKWSDWQEVDSAEGGRDGRAVTTTEPVWTGPADRLQVRATRAGRTATDDVSAIAVDPGTSPNDTRIAAMAEDVDQPTVVSRAQWGADESIMTWTPEFGESVRAVGVHHTAETNDYDCVDSPAIVRGIYRYHAINRGWGDIGYHALVDKCGTVFEGRAGGQRLPLIGGHAYGFNRDTYGISIMGTHTSVPPTAETLESVARVAAWKLAGNYVDPRSTATLTSAGGNADAKYPVGTKATIPVIFGHRDVVLTECPGTETYNRLGTIRDRVVVLMGDWKASPIYQKRQAVNAGWTVFGAEQAETGGGRSTLFNGGATTIAYRSDLGAHWVNGAINAKFHEAGGLAGLGYPTNDETRTADGLGYFNHFTNNASVFYSAATGAHAVTGVFWTKWQELGFEKSYLGYPATDVYAVDGAKRQDFQGGTILVSTSTGRVMIYRKGSFGGIRR